MESLSKVMEVHFTEGSVIYKVHIKFFFPISLDIGLPPNKETEEQIGYIQRNFFYLAVQPDRNDFMSEISNKVQGNTRIQNCISLEKKMHTLGEGGMSAHCR